MLAAILEVVAPHLDPATYWKVVACLIPLAALGGLGLLALVTRLVVIRFSPDAFKD